MPSSSGGAVIPRDVPIDANGRNQSPKSMPSPRHVLPQAHERHDQRAQERHPGQRRDDPPRNSDAASVARPTTPSRKPISAGVMAIPHQHDRERPLPPHHQHRTGQQPEDEAPPPSESRRPARTESPPPRTPARTRHRGSNRAPHRAACPTTKAHPGPVRGLPRRGHALQPTGGGRHISGDFRQAIGRDILELGNPTPFTSEARIPAGRYAHGTFTEQVRRLRGAAGAGGGAAARRTQPTPDPRPTARRQQRHPQPTPGG